MPLKLDRADAVSLYELVEISRDDMVANWKDRLDQDLALYRSKHWDKGEGRGLNQITVNYTRSGIEIKCGSQTYQKPQFDAQPLPLSAEDPSAFVALDQNDRTLNIIISERVTRDFEESSAWESNQAALYDKRIFGIGAVMYGWHPGDEEPLSDEEMNEHLQMIQEMAEMPGVDASTLPEPPQDLRGEGGVAIRISPYNLIADTEVDGFDWQNARYLGRVYTMDKQDLERDLDLRGVKQLTGYENFSDTAEKAILDPADRSRVDQKNHPFVVLYEVWFRKVWLRNGFTDDDGRRYPKGYYPLKVTWSADKPTDPILVETWPYDLRDSRGKRLYPFVLQINGVVPGKLKGMSDCEIAEPQQLELNASRAKEATFADTAARVKFVYDKTKLDTQALNNLASPEVGAQIGVTGPVGDDIIRPLEFPGGHPETEAQGEHALRDMNALTGVDEMSQGVAVEGAKTATEIREIKQSSGGRAAKEDEKFESALTAGAQILWQLRVQFDKTGDMVNVAIPQGIGQSQSPPQGAMDPMSQGMGPMGPGGMPPLPMGSQGMPQGVPQGMPGQMGGIQQIQIEPRHLMPAQIKIVTGSTKMQDQMQDVESRSNAIQLLATTGLLATVQNPTGIVSSRYMVEGLLKSMEIDNGDPALYDTQEYMQQAMQIAQMQQQMQQEQMAQQMAMQQAGQPPSPGSPGGLQGGGPPPQSLPPQGPPPGMPPPSPSPGMGQESPFNNPGQIAQ